MKVHWTTLAGFALLLCMLLQACGGTPVPQTANPPQPTQPVAPPVVPTEMPTQAPPPVVSTEVPTQAPVAAPTTAPIQHLTYPGLPSYIDTQSAVDCTMTDTMGNPILPLKLNPTCDLWSVNRIERPVTSDLATYFPYLDIQKAQLGADKDWIYARIRLVSPVPQQGSGDLTYFFVLDLNVDGLNDALIAVQNLPMSTVVWTDTGLRVWTFADNAVKLIFDQGVGTDPDAVWVRRSTSKTMIEFAFKPSLLDGDITFAWSGWALQGQFDPSQILPVITLPDMYQIDNTCALGFNSNASHLPNWCH